MPATRLLVIADAKMLPTLANGLRDGARFDVLTLPLSDSAGAQAALEKADALALFYGAPGAPLPAALQSLSPRIRDRGGRVVAVLQRDQAAHRDECFRAGASDLLFMPMPKDQFVARLQGSLDLAWAAEGGVPAQVSVATRTAASKVDRATVSAAGVEAGSELPVKAGETVRLSWASFQSWGLVVRGGPSALIRFAGLAPDEETRIRDWLKSGAAASSTPPQGSGPAAPVLPPPGGSVVAAGAPTPPGGSAVAAGAPTPPGTTAAVPAALAADAPTPASGTASARAAPAAGPPPGFADRKPVRAQTRSPVRVAPPVMTAGGAAAAPAAAASGNGAPASPLFAEDSPTPAAPAAAVAPEAAAPAGPAWPNPVPPATCKAAVMQLLKDKSVGSEVPPNVVASARKVTSMLGSSERAALEKGGVDSHIADALAARIALDAATAEGVKLYSSSPAPTVEGEQVSTLTRQADEAASRLQKEANAAVGKGEVELLQMVTATSAALSRDLLNFRETADRLRGLSAAPRLSAGALDPDMVLLGQAPRPAAPRGSTPAPVRAELRDFHNLDGGSGRSKTVLMVLALAAFVVALANAVYFSIPHHTEISAEAAGRGVERIDVSGTVALVTVTNEWLEKAETRIPLLLIPLREAGVERAILILPNGSPAGILNVATGKVSGLAKPKPAPAK